MSTKLFVAQLL